MFRFMSVAVVRNDANINYPGDLRDKISCHTGYGRTAGWHMPIPRVSNRNRTARPLPQAAHLHRII